MANKYGIVASGGGMKCAYTVGVALALADLGLTDPEFIVCGSGSAAIFAYWISKQYKSGINIWENILSSSKFISFKRLNKIIDIDYVIDNIFKEKEPLLVNLIKASKINLLIGVTNFDSGVGEFFSNHDNVDIFEVLRASKATPLVYDKKVIINGKNYIDGDVALPLHLRVKKALELDFDKLIIIDNTNNFRVNKLISFIYSLFVNKKLQNTIRNNSESKKIAIQDNFIFITPSKKLSIKALDNNKKLIRETIKIGYEDTINNLHLQELSKNKSSFKNNQSVYNR